MDNLARSELDAARDRLGRDRDAAVSVVVSERALRPRDREARRGAGVTCLGLV
jgi:hypothetical protein